MFLTVKTVPSQTDLATSKLAYLSEIPKLLKVELIE